MERRRRPGQVSLERALSKLGVASRTVARQWIEGGKVKVNGVLRREPLYPVNPERARIEVEGNEIRAAELRYFVLHKPKGVITTRSDEKGRQTVFSFLEAEKVSHLHAVGRLDAATTGLLVLTNDTRFSSWATDPASGVPRVYLVTVRGEVGAETVERLTEGVVVERERLGAKRAVLRKASGKESHLVLELDEGKNREIRRLLLALGHEVTRLKRVSFGALELGELLPGKYRELTAQELTQAFPTYRPNQARPARD